MDGIGATQVMRWLLGKGRANLVATWGGFRPNAGSTPDATLFRGPLRGQFTVSYAATGLYTVSATPSGFKFVTGNFPTILLTNTCADQSNTHRFQVQRKGNWDNTNRRFVIQACQESAAFAVPSNADNWIDFIIFGET